MKKENSLQDLKSLLHSIVSGMEGAPLREQLRIQNMWEAVVGLHIAKKASPEGVKNGTLFVSVESSVWMQELTFMKQQILERLTQSCESSRVKDIRFKLGKISQRMGSYDDEMAPELNEEEQAMIKKQTANVEDEEIRASLQSLLSSDLKNKKKRSPGL